MWFKEVYPWMLDPTKTWQIKQKMKEIDDPRHSTTDSEVSSRSEQFCRIVVQTAEWKAGGGEGQRRDRIGRDRITEVEKEGNQWPPTGRLEFLEYQSLGVLWGLAKRNITKKRYIEGGFNCFYLLKINTKSETIRDNSDKNTQDRSTSYNVAFYGRVCTLGMPHRHQQRVNWNECTAW